MEEFTLRGPELRAVTGRYQYLRGTIARLRVALTVVEKVANLSLGGNYSQAFNTAVHNAVKADLCMVVAVGNSNEDARHFLRPPSRLPTVGSIDVTDTKSGFSN